MRAATDQDVSGPVTDAFILAFVNEEYPLVRRMVARIAPDWFATESGDLVVGSTGTEIDVSGLTNLDLVFEVRRLYGNRYRPIDAAGPDPEGGSSMSYRRRGMSGAGTALELYPVSMAPGTYRVRYMATAPALTGSGAVLLPAGGERVLSESAAERVRERLERDYTKNYKRRDSTLAELAAQLGVVNYVVRPSAGRQMGR